MNISTTGHANARAAYMRGFEKRQITLFGRVAAYVNENNDLNTAACLDVTFGQGASLNCLLGSNGVERTRLAARLASHTGKQARANDYEMALVTFRDKSWAFDPAASVFDLPLLRRVSNRLKKIGASSVGVVQVGCLPHVNGEFEHVPQVKAVVCGKDLRTLLPGAVHKLQCKYQRVIPQEKPIVVEWLDHKSRRSGYMHVAELFDMGDPLRAAAKALLVNGDTEWRAARADRALRRYQVLTMCSLDKLVMATGELSPILEGALREGTSRARKLYAASDKPLHRDQLIHFWLEQQLRRSQAFVLPFVKAR